MGTVLGNVIIFLSIVFSAAATNTSTKAAATNAPSKTEATTTSQPTGEPELKRLTLSRTNVGELLRNGYVYVDKTQYVVRLLKSPHKYYFLARPRHFGKTTFLSTFKEIFQNADKKLFNGTAIYKSDFMWPIHPVVSISMSDGMKFNTPEELRESIIESLKKVAVSYDIVSINGTDMMEVVHHLMSMLHQKFSKKVIVLVDAYDYPYTEMYEELDVAEKNIDVLRAFFAAIYSAHEDIRIGIVVGVLKLAGCNLDEAWEDITLDQGYTAVAGFTQEELELNFAGHIDSVVKHRQNTTREEVLNYLKNWHHGHRFTPNKITVYNPWSIISYFISKGVQESWPQWLSPRFFGLKKKLAQHPDYVLDYLHGRRNYHRKYIEMSHVDRDWEEGLNELEMLLLLNGCLTIKKYDPKRDFLKLGFANRETRETFFGLLVRGFGNKKYNELRQTVANLKSDLEKLDLIAFVRKSNFYINTFLSNATDADDHLSSHLPVKKITDEILHVIFRTALMLADMEIDPHTTMADRLEEITVFINKKLYLFQLRLTTDPVDVCIEQYHRRYSGQNVVCVGIKFDCKNRQIIDCDAAEMSNEGKEIRRESMYKYETLDRDEGDLTPPPPVPGETQDDR